VFDPYAVFGESRSASQTTLKKTYQKLMIEWHPDRHSNSSSSERDSAEARAVDINRAWGILGDPEKRAIYDKYGHTDDYNISEEIRKKKERRKREDSANWALVRPGKKDEEGGGKSGKSKGKSKGGFGKKK
jgi:curved DNA-binding protein CbpA